MLYKGSLLFSLVTAFFIFSSFLFSFTLGWVESDFHTFQTPPISGIILFSLISLSKDLLFMFFFWCWYLWVFLGEGRSGNDVVVSGEMTKRYLAESPNGEPPLNSSLILAAKRTYRKDPFDNFKRYTGGWNISERHYWAVSIQCFYLSCELLTVNLSCGFHWSILTNRFLNYLKKVTA